jgi:hypothetical protein
VNPLNLYETENINVKGDYETNEFKITYGSIVNDNVDGYLIITNKNTNQEITRIIYDDLGFEIFNYVADMGNDEIIIICDRYYLSGDFEIPLFKDVLLMKYNFQGDKLSQKILQEKPAYYNNHNNYLIITDRYNTNKYMNSNMEYVSSIEIEEEYIEKYSTQFQGIATINGEAVNTIDIQYPGNYEIYITNNLYAFSYSITVHPLVIINGNEFNDYEYIGNISISAYGDMELNGENYISGETITKPGYYNLIINGANDYEYQKSIKVIPTITYLLGDSTYDFMDELIVYQAITIYSNGITVLVNEEIYHSEEITDTGTYDLVIYGVNGMQYQLSFLICPEVIGIEHLGIYDQIDFSIFGEAFLNGEIISGEVHLDTPGLYKLDLLFDDNIYESYEFSIREKDLSVVEADESPFNYNYIFFVFIALGGILILRKK